MSKYGVTIFEDSEGNEITIHLTEQADFTNRLINGGEGLSFQEAQEAQEAQEGESYTFEMMAHGLIGEQEVIAYWMFDAIKGQEPELNSYDYSKCDYLRYV